MAMELLEDALVDLCQGHTSEIRMIHSPEAYIETLKDGKSKRIWPCTHFGILALLAHGSTGGLQIEDKTKRGTFMNVRLENNTELLLNVGDTLERWTNGRIEAGLHRVEIPDEVVDGVLPERYSVAFRKKANRRTSASPIPIFVPEGTTSKYKEMTALEYHRLRISIMY